MIKRLIVLHHWLGTFFSVLFLIWFLSGFVMMYHSFPFLSNHKKIELLPIKSIKTPLLNPNAIFKENIKDTIHSLKLNFQLNRPVIHLVSTNGDLISKYADSGSTININHSIAVAIAKEHLNINSNATTESIN